MTQIIGIVSGLLDTICRKKRKCYIQQFILFKMLHRGFHENFALFGEVFTKQQNCRLVQMEIICRLQIGCISSL